MAILYSTTDATLDYTVSDQWPTGFVGRMSVTFPEGTDYWRVEFELDAEIDHIWNGRIVSRTGNTYVVEGFGYNSSLPPGGSASFGFVAKGAETVIDPDSVAIDDAIAPPPPTEDTPPDLTISATSAVEGTDATAGFDLTLSEASDEPVTVYYETFDQTAGAPSDYQPTTGSIVIPAGSTTAVIDIPITDDGDYEPEETFGLRIVSTEGAEIATAEAIATIIDNDPEPIVLPMLSVADITVGEGDPPDGTGSPGGSQGTPADLTETVLSTTGAQIVDADGNAVQIKAVNWFGMETDTFSPHGLWARNWQDMMDQMLELGFNAIRLPFSAELVLETPMPNGIDYSLNPDLAGLTSLQIMARILDYADDIGLGVVLDHHRSEAGNGANDNGLWYSGTYSEADWLMAWNTLADVFGDHPAVIGADLHNEPHGPATWGGGGATDWALAAETAGNLVHQSAPDWLIFVEGIGNYQGDNYWWGGNLAGVADRPVVLDQAGKLVYSPHDYPASVYDQPWFNDGSDLYEVFRDHWGFIVEDGLAPVFIGEMGSRLETARDQAWADALTAYLSGDFDGDGSSDQQAGDADISFAWWSWNPNSGDTGGILLDDWSTPRDNALDLLAPFLEDGGTVPEGDGGSGEAPDPVLAEITVQLDAPADNAIEVAYATEDGTAEAGSDYVATSGSLTFAPGEQQKTIHVEILPDTEPEGDETFNFVFTGNLDGDLTSTVTIVDDDGFEPDPPDDDGPEDTPDDPGTGLSAEFVVINDWGSGATLNITITNHGSEAVSDWNLGFHLDAGIQNIWNAVITDAAESAYEIDDDGWNAMIGAGSAITVGFNTTSGGFDAAQLNEDAQFLF